MNRKKHVQPTDEGQLRFDDLQPYFDRQSHHIDNLLAQAQPPRVAERQPSARRNNAMLYLALAVANLTIGIVAASQLLGWAGTIAHLTGYLFVGVCGAALLGSVFALHQRRAAIGMRPLVTLTLTAALVLTTVACTHPDDGHQMSQFGSAKRAATIEVINNILQQN